MASARSEPLLKITGLRLGIGAAPPMFGPIDVDLRAGELVGLTGPSGTGKTLLARAIVGLLPRTVVQQGSIRRHPPDAPVCLLVQQPRGGLDPLRRIGRQIRAVARDRRSERLDDEQVATLLTRVGLGESLAHRFPHQLSGGECQRAMIALGLAAGAWLLIADEDTAVLAVLSGRRVLELLHALARDEGLGVLLISHDRSALTGCRRVIALAPPAADQGPVAPVPVRPPPGPPLLSARGLGLAGVDGPRLDGVDLDLYPGCITALVGPSGCGKTTLARALARLQALDRGRLELDGQAIDTLLDRDRRGTRRRVQVVFQDPATALNPRQRVCSALAEALPAGGDVDAALAGVDLPPDLAGHWPHQLSGGQRQRVALARALACDPQVLIADEPVSSLDAESGRLLLGLLHRLTRERSLALLLISHDLASVRALADEVLVMDAGRIVEAGPAERVLAAPEHPLTRALCAAVAPLESP